MLDQLCSFFRYSLDENAHKKSNLSKELELLELYLSIEKVRFGDRLTVTLDISQESLAAQIPTLLLQPIVENAIKHGIESRKENGKIKVSSLIKDNNVILTVEDNGVGDKSSSEKGFGIGLSNTRERLSTLFNQPCEPKIIYSDSGTKVQVVFPFKKV